MAYAIWLYVSLVFTHWIGVLTGGLLAAVSTVWHGLSRKAWPRWLFATSFLLGGYAVSSYQTWEDQVTIVSQVNRNFNGRLPQPKTEDITWFTDTPPYQGQLRITFDEAFVHPFLIVVADQDCEITSSGVTMANRSQMIARNVFVLDVQDPGVAKGDSLVLSISAEEKIHVQGIASLLRVRPTTIE